MSEITMSGEQRWAEEVKKKPWLNSIPSWDDYLCGDYEEGKLFAEFWMTRSTHNWTDKERQKINEILSEPYSFGDSLYDVWDDLEYCFLLGLPDRDSNDGDDFTGMLFMMDCLVMFIKHCNDAIQKRAAGMADKGETMLNWDDSEKQRRADVEAGKTVVANKRKSVDVNLIKWAKAEGRYVDIDRTGIWGNFTHPPLNKKGTNRDEVCDNHIKYFNSNVDLKAKIDSLKGKVLGCWCYPKRCHGDHLASIVNRDESL